MSDETPKKRIVITLAWPIPEKAGNVDAQNGMRAQRIIDDDWTDYGVSILIGDELKLYVTRDRWPLIKEAVEAALAYQSDGIHLQCGKGMLACGCRLQSPMTPAEIAHKYEDMGL